MHHLECKLLTTGGGVSFSHVGGNYMGDVTAREQTVFQKGYFYILSERRSKPL